MAMIYSFAATIDGGAKFYKHQLLYIKKPKTLGYHHVKGHQHQSKWTGEKWGVKMSTNCWTPCMKRAQR